MSKTILAVDDSSSLRKMVALTLRGKGYEVVEAADGEEALAKAVTGKFGLVITDQNMPRMDGMALTRALRKMPAYALTPILVLTTESGDDMKSQGRAAGATGWLVKPFDPPKLVSMVQKVLG